MNAPPPRSGALLVGAGIFLSRVAGLIRQKVFAHYFSTSIAADAFQAAFRIPNLLQNLFGEGVLSASFIPEYAGLLARNEKQKAERLSAAVLGILALIASVVVLLGILLAPLLVTVIAGGFSGEKRQLTIQLTRILFPGAALLVFSAWALGVLNSHRKFFFSYAAPVAWNIVIIAALIGFGAGRPLDSLAVVIAWASVLGSALQFGVQLPFILSTTGTVRLRVRGLGAHELNVFRNFVPTFFARGVVQISSFVDEFIASWLPHGALATLSYAQVIYMLPVSLFGMAVSAAELPVMASAVGSNDEVARYLRGRLDAGLERIAFFILPTVVAFLALGDVVASTLYESGRFTRADSLWVWQVLSGATVGLLASTWGRLYASTFYALRDTRTPLKFAIIRVATATALGAVAALLLPRWLGVHPRLGLAGLTVGSGIAAWLEFFLLRAAIERRIGATSLRPWFTLRLWIAALAAAVIAWGFKLGLSGPHPVWTGLTVLTAYGLSFLFLSTLLGISEATALSRRLRLRR